MDRVAIARAERRRQATEELEFERGRAAALEEEVARLVVELDGPGVDEQVFPGLAPEHVEVVRAALHGTPTVEDESEEDEWFTLDDGDPEAERAELEREIVRLQAEIASSRRRQEAFERYLEALGD